MNVSQSEIRLFQETVLNWYKIHKRDLPRRYTTDPYKILISETMSQQTQVSRVIPKYIDRIQRWPTIQDFSSASRGDVLAHRTGLGFNRRAINLHEACKILAEKCQSEINHTYWQNIPYLLSLPGIGDYTSHAICAFAFNMPVPVVDINIKRVFIHTFGLEQTITHKDIKAIAQKCIPEGKSRDWHNALMDYGAMVLTSKVTGITSPKQSTFQGSDREVRGWVMKQIAQCGSIDLFTTCKQFPQKKVESLLQKMIKENLIVEKEGKFTYPEW